MHVYASHQEAYVAETGTRQSLFQIGNTIGKDIELVCTDYTSRWLKFATRPDALSTRTQASLVGYDRGIKLNNLQRTEATIVLGDPLEELVSMPTQLGIIRKHATKILFAPDVELVLPPPYAKDEFMRERNAKWYARVVDARGTKLRKAIDGYLSEDYHPLDRAYFFIKQLVTPIVYSPVKRTEEQTRELDLKKPSDRLIVLLKNKDTSLRQYGACTVLEHAQMAIVRNDARELPKIKQCLRSDPGVLSTRIARHIVMPLPKPSIAKRAFGTLEHVALLNAYTAHRVSRGQGVTVAVMDSGVDYRHPALAKHFDTPGYDFVKNDADPMDEHGHGTHVAGIVASIAPEVMLRAVRVLDAHGAGNEADIMLGYDYCYRNKIPIINCSFGGYLCSPEEQELIEQSRMHGSLIIAAAGNEASELPSYPAALNGVLSIASVNKSKEHSRFSNECYVDFAALGENVYSTLPGGGYGTMSGTSMAAPCVAGAFALQAAVSSQSLDDRVMLAASRCQRANGPAPQYEDWFGYGIPDCARWVE